VSAQPISPGSVVSRIRRNQSIADLGSGDGSTALSGSVLDFTLLPARE
jgi:hypothetical protein